MSLTPNGIIVIPMSSMNLTDIAGLLHVFDQPYDHGFDISTSDLLDMHEAVWVRRHCDRQLIFRSSGLSEAILMSRRMVK